MSTMPQVRSLALPALALALSACAGGAATSSGAPTAAAAPLERAAATITADDMAARIAWLASDELRGRDTPSPGLEAAARYLATEFAAMGLQPAGDSGTFIQRFPFTNFRMDPARTMLRLRGQAGGAPRYGADFFLVAGARERVEGPALYAGVAGAGTALPPEARGAVVIFDLPGAALDAAWQAGLARAVTAAIPAGASAVGVILDSAFPQAAVQGLATSVVAQQAPVPIFGITASAAEALLAPAGVRLPDVRASGAGPLRGVVLEVGGVRTGAESRVPNVAAMLPGSDPALRDTYLVLTAHFDHVGVGDPDASGDSIYNGADDNASGTAGLLEVAQAFAALPDRPARSVIFLAVSGEEKGLLGSMHFAANPTVPAGQIVANFNMDMIGRNAPDTLIAIGQEYSTLGDALSAAVAAHPEVGLTVIRDPYPQERLFFRSDQLSFIQKGIPSLFFFTGLHDQYHKPSDEPELINADKAARVARLLFLVSHRVATEPVKPEWTPEGRRQIQSLLGGGGG